MATSQSAGGVQRTGPIDNLLYDELGLTFFDNFSTRIDHQFSNNLKAYTSWTHNRQSGYGRPTNIDVLDFDATNGNYYAVPPAQCLGGHHLGDQSDHSQQCRIGFFRRRSDRDVPSYKKNYGQIWEYPISQMNCFLPSGQVTNSLDSIYGLNVTGPSLNIGETLSFREDFLQDPWHAFVQDGL